MRLKEIRREKGMNQTQLAELAGLTQAFVCEIETGKKTPSFATLVRIAKALNCSLDELAGMEETA